MTAFNKRKPFHFLGASIVLFWLVMVFLLVQKTHFQGKEFAADFPIDGKPVERFQHEWMEIYLKGNKVGFSEMRMSPLDNEHLVEERMVLALNLMGQPNVLRMSTRAVLDKRHSLKRFLMIIDSGVVRFRVRGTVDAEQISVETGEGDKKRKLSIPVSGPLTIGAGLPGFFRGRTLKIGDEFRFTLFDPSILSHRNVVIRVVERTVLSIDGEKIPTFRLEAELWGQKLVFWLNDDGLLLKEEGFMGLTLVRSDKERAPRDVDGSEGADLYDAAAVPVSRKLDRARDVAYLKLRIEGIQNTGFDLTALNEGRQRLKGDLLEVFREWVSDGPSSRASEARIDPHLRPFLLPEINIQSDDSALVEKARKIVGDDENRQLVARKLMGWVYENVEKRPVVSVPDALAVLEALAGDCNEHAVLLTALLRASGIPARECVGIVYTDHRFFYHAWTEAWLGRWVSMDATLNQMPVDATHIKLVHGGLGKQAELMRLMGRLKLTIVDYLYD